MTKRSALAWLSLSAVSLFATFGCDEVVGGNCADTATACGNLCCSAQELCSQGMCVLATPGDGEGGSGGKPIDILGSGGGSEGGSGTRPGTDVPGCGVGTVRCDDGCRNLFNDPDNCGDCGIECAADEVCSAGVCQPTCDEELLLCSGLCIDPEDDPNNCGECGTVCETGICLLGACSPPLPGHLVAIGHGYEPPIQSGNRLVGNAVFIPQKSTVDVLIFEEYANHEGVAGANAVIDGVGANTGRTAVRTPTSAHHLTGDLLKADVLLIYPQPNASDAALLEHSATWANAMMGFMERGGVVAVLDTDRAAENAGTWQVLSALPQDPIQGSAPVDEGSILDVMDPTDALVLGMPTSYGAGHDAVRFWTSYAPVVEDLQSDPGAVVLHLNVVPE